MPKQQVKVEVSIEESKKIMWQAYHDMKKRKSQNNLRMMERIRELAKTMDLAHIRK